jgi:hypothetical protein
VAPALRAAHVGQRAAQRRQLRVAAAVGGQPGRFGFQADAQFLTDLRVVPVAGQDSMLLNLSGAHGPWFTRNIVILTDSAGNTGLGEVPGGEKIRQTIEDARPARRRQDRWATTTTS